MIDLGSFTYASPPKSGNQWFVAALRRAGLPAKHAGMHAPGHVEGKPRVTIVREPATWLRSYFRNMHGSIGMPQVDIFQMLRSGHGQKFEDFGWRYVNELPGQISKMCMCYEAEIELRTEHLTDDTVALLELFEIPFDPEAVRGLGRVGVTVSMDPIPDELRAAINATDFYLGDRTPAPAQSRGLSLKGSV